MRAPRRAGPRAGRETRALLAAAVLLLSAVGCAPRDEAGARCGLCGMDAGASKGRFLMDLEDGTRLDACSGRCAGLLVAKRGSGVYRVRVHGHDAGGLVDGRKATYVLGAGRVPDGSMRPSVFAFAGRQAAEAFVAEHGGRLAGLEEVFAMASPPEAREEEER